MSSAETAEDRYLIWKCDEIKACGVKPEDQAGFDAMLDASKLGHEMRMVFRHQVLREQLIDAMLAPFVGMAEKVLRAARKVGR